VERASVTGAFHGMIAATTPIGHGPSSNAERAAATAWSMSAVVAAGTSPTTSSVEGEITSSRPVPAGAVQAHG
jgi:hypothetical protein